MTSRGAHQLARSMSAKLGRGVFVIRDESGLPILSSSSSPHANGRLLIGAPEDVRENGTGYCLASTGERIDP